MADLLALRTHLAALRWTQRTLADVLVVDARLVRRWFTGARPMPPEVEAWLVALATQVWNAPRQSTHTVADRPAPWPRLE